MYGNFNMGVGFAIYTSTKHVATIIKIAKQHNLRAWNAGTVKKGPKQVVIKQKNIVFKSETLGVR